MVWSFQRDARRGATGIVPRSQRTMDKIGDSFLHRTKSGGEPTHNRYRLRGFRFARHRICSHLLHGKDSRVERPVSPEKHVVARLLIHHQSPSHVNSAGGGSSSPKTALLPVLVGVFGGLVLFLIIVTLILWRYRRRRHHPSQFFSSHPPSTWDTSPPASVRPLAIPPVAYVPRPSISASSEGGTAPVAWFMPSPGTALPPSYFTGPVNNGQRDKYPDCGSSNPLKGISRERRGVI